MTGEKPESTPQADQEQDATPPRDLETCPRCGTLVGQVVWGQTNCPQCGLHFECC